MSANDNNKFIKKEIEWMKLVIDSNVPFLGICLGAQILAKYLGSKVYKHIDGLIKENEYSDLKDLTPIENDILINYSQVLSAVTSEDILCPDLAFDGNEPEPFNLLSKLLIKLFSKEKSTERKRFRRLIPDDAISLFSEMVFSLTDEETFNSLKNRIQ